MRSAAAAALALLLATPSPSTAQAAAAPPEKAHRVEKLSARAYAIFGPGGNVGLFVGDQDAVLVDAQLEAGAAGLLEAVTSVTDKPVRFLVNTHHHGDHVGGNPRLAPKVQAVVAHSNVRKRMAAEQEKLDPARRGGLPTLVLGEPDPAKPGRLDVELPGLELHLVHRSAAHTDGDVLVGMPSDLVLQMGDTLFLGMLPFVDVEGGGSFAGLLETVTWLVSWLPEGAKIIPGHGPVCGKKELVRYRDFLAAVLAHAKASPGKTSRELAESFDAAAWPEWKPAPAFVTWETLFDAATGRGPGRVPRPKG